MRRAALIIAIAALAAGCRHGQVKPASAEPITRTVTLEKPVPVKVVEVRYVPIDSEYVRPIVHDELPLWQCPLERDQLREKLKKANGDREAVGAIRGTKTKGGK